MSRNIQIAVVLLFLSSWAVRADGGLMRLRETKGRLIVTVFTTAEPVQHEAAEVSILVQEQDAVDPILDADVALTFTAPFGSFTKTTDQFCGPPGRAYPGEASPGARTHFTVKATRDQGSNKLLYTAPIEFSEAANWHLDVIVKDGPDSAKVSCNIPVGPAPHRVRALFPYLMLPPLMVAFFTANQFLRRSSLEKRADMGTAPQVPADAWFAERA